MNHFISLQTAIDMTTVYRQNRLAILKTEYQQQDILSLSETFDRAAIDVLLSKSGCTKLRIYYGMDTDMSIHAILVAADAENADILPAANAVESIETEEDDIAERGIRCPEICPEPSVLNS